MQQKRVTLVISSLGSGGAERVLCWLANQWAKKGLQVTIITLSGAEIPLCYSLNPAVQLTQLGISASSSHPLQGLLSNLKRLFILRRVIIASRPDAVISFMDRTNVRVLFALVGCNIPIIVSEHTNPDYLQGRVWHLLRRISYPWAQRVVVLTDRTKEMLAFVRSKISIIPNPVSVLADDGSAPPFDFSTPIVFAMGRLVELKRFDLLIGAFAEARKSCPDWSLMILGEGPERPHLEALVTQLALDDAVKLPGRFADPERILRHGNLFVLSSRYEGFPNAICEALACGLPVIATDCPTGPREIIRDGCDGLLVPNEDEKSLSAAMQKLMGDVGLRERMAVNALDICERFSSERIIALWDKAIAGGRS